MGTMVRMTIRWDRYFWTIWRREFGNSIKVIIDKVCQIIVYELKVL